MNHRALKNKKLSQPNIKNYLPDRNPNFFSVKQTANENKKSLATCTPKLKPGVPENYLQFTKKKQNTNKENKYQQNHCYFTKKHSLYQNTCTNISLRVPRSSYNKKQNTSKNCNANTRPYFKAAKQRYDDKFMLHNRIDQRSKSRQLLNKEYIKNDQISESSSSDSSTENENDLSCKQIIMNKIRCELSHISQITQTQNSISSIIRPKLKSFKEEMNQFEQQYETILSQFESSTLQCLQSKQKQYCKQQNYSCFLLRNQTRITWFQRGIIIKWMIQICESFGSTRETLAIAVSILDRYLACSSTITLDELQLIACGALSISNKLDGMKFDMSSISQQTESITQDEIITMQQKICMKLKWKLNQPTANMWANRIAKQWDMYMQSKTILPPGIQQKHQQIQFKSQTSPSYFNFRMLMQYIDFSLLDSHTLRYYNREIAASFIYIILNIKLQLFQAEYISENFAKKSQYLTQYSQLNEFFCQFLTFSFGFSLQELLPTVQYCSTFCILPLRYNLPQIVQHKPENQMTIEQFYSYQTLNQDYLKYLIKRDRSFD